MGTSAAKSVTSSYSQTGNEDAETGLKGRRLPTTFSIGCGGSAARWGWPTNEFTNETGFFVPVSVAA